MSRKLELLLVDDDDQFAHDFQILGKGIFDIRRASSGERALEMLAANEPDAVILDLRLGAGIDGLQTLKMIRADFDLPVIMVTDYANVETAVEAMKLGAFHYTSKHPNMKELHAVITRELRQLSWKSLFVEESGMRLGTMVGSSPCMKRIFKLIPKYAQSAEPILITGDTGTGKTMLAKEIHRHSPRAQAPFVRVDCGAIPATLFESEIFGHERGAFTGAVARRKGKFELADGGTLLLDDVTEMDYHLQSKLLGVLETKTFLRVGGEKEITADVRIIAATNQDIQQEVRAKRFRQDLFYRLNTISIELPPLRERREDIPVLVDFIMKNVRQQSGIRCPGFTKEALKKLKNYSWPGNIRELENVVKRALIKHPGDRIQPDDLEFSRVSDGAAEPFEPLLKLPYAKAREKVLLDFKKAYLSELIKRNDGNITQAARESGLPRTSLHRMLKELDGLMR